MPAALCCRYPLITEQIPYEDLELSAKNAQEHTTRDNRIEKQYFTIKNNILLQHTEDKKKKGVSRATRQQKLQQIIAWKPEFV